MVQFSIWRSDYDLTRIGSGDLAIASYLLIPSDVLTISSICPLIVSPPSGTIFFSFFHHQSELWPDVLGKPMCLSVASELTHFCCSVWRSGALSVSRYDIPRYADLISMHGVYWLCADSSSSVTWWMKNQIKSLYPRTTPLQNPCHPFCLCITGNRSANHNFWRNQSWN